MNQDYSESDHGNNLVKEDQIFLYNQSQNPSSGSRGIACVALALINNKSYESDSVSDDSHFTNIFEDTHFENIFSTDVIPPTDGKCNLFTIQ